MNKHPTRGYKYLHENHSSKTRIEFLSYESAGYAKHNRQEE
jgi:hypothetical protein